MTSRVTLNVFSGRPNPTWLLSEQDDQKLMERLAAQDEPTDKRPSGVYGGLGYRGFSITRDTTHPHGPLALSVHEGIVDQQLGGPNVVDHTGLESWLAETGRAHTPDVIQEHLKESIAQRAVLQFPIKLGTTCPTCHAADAPAYNPGAWNIPAVQPYNNCYNYANNLITNTFAQPGRATGHMYTALTCGSVQPAAQSDGLVPVANFSGTLAAGKGWYVALVIWPNADFHWYRQDKVGCWSHKPGSTAVRNVDNAGHAITDPKTCNRGPYTTFCTYMVTKHGVHIS
jgi:hypothetical protein